MMLRGRLRERDDGPGEGGVPANVYQMRQQMFAIGDDFWIQNGAGQRVFKIDGKALRIRSTLVFEDAAGRELYKIQERMVRIRDTMEIEGPNGTVATVKKALITPLRERFDVEVEHGEDMEVKGNIVDHEYRIREGDTDVAEVSKEWFRVADTYGVEVAEGQDPVLILAVAAALDSMTHAGR